MIENMKYAITVRVRNRRQITLPNDVCQALGVDVGDEVSIDIEEGAAVIRSRRRASLDALEELRRAFAASGLTEDELLEGAAEVRREIFRDKYPDLARKYGV